jgi:hypothetical protein
MAVPDISDVDSSLLSIISQFLGEPQARIPQRQGLRGHACDRRRLLPLVQQDTRRGLIPWNWRLAELQETPLATYEELLAAMRRARQSSLLDTAIYQEFDVADAECYGARCFLTQLADHIRSAAVNPRIKEVPRDSWQIVRDDDTPIEARCRLLQTLISDDEATAAQFIAEELNRADLPHLWRNYLILCAENVQFAGEPLRTMLRARLFELANVLRKSNESEIRSIVFSAIRTYASLLDQSDAASLLTFLEPPALVETRLVALHCIVHLFESSPPQSVRAFPALSNRVFDLAEKFLDRDWLVPGEKAAIGENAAHALAAMGDERLRDCVTRIKALQLPWLSRHVSRKLDSTLRAWKARVGHLSAVYDFVQKQLNVLSK